MNYYPHHIGDYLTDTAHLSVVEDGIYRRLIDLYYTIEGPLTDDMDALCRRIRVSDDEAKYVRAVLDEFFTPCDLGYSHKRCDAELTRMKCKRTKAIESAEMRWHSKGNANAVRTQCERNATNTNTNTNTNKEQKQTRRKASLPVPVDWMPKPETEKRAMAEFSLTPELVKRFVVAFQDICQAKGYTYANIDAAFINCIRKDWPGLRTQIGKTVTPSAAAKLPFVHEEKKPEYERANPELVRKLLAGAVKGVSA